LPAHSVKIGENSNKIKNKNLQTNCQKSLLPRFLSILTSCSPTSGLTFIYLDIDIKTNKKTGFSFLQDKKNAFSNSLS
jgi:hypothetical protein